MPSDLSPVTVRVPRVVLERLDALAADRGLSRSRLVRQAIEALVAGRPLPAAEPPDEAELRALLAVRAREGSVAAIRSLLVREEVRDPREAALRALEAIAAERRA